MSLGTKTPNNIFPPSEGREKVRVGPTPSTFHSNNSICITVLDGWHTYAHRMTLFYKYDLHAVLNKAF